MVLTSNKASSIRDLINQFIIEARSEQFEYARVLADFVSREENALNLAAGDIVAVVPKDDEYTQRGWLYGIKNGKYGLFPADYVDKMSPRSIRKEIKTISRITQPSQKHRVSSQNGSPIEDLTSTHSPLPLEDDEDFSPGNTWDQRHRGDSYDAGDNSDVSISAGKVANDGKHPLLEFAMTHFREIDVINGDNDKKKKKKKNSKSDWTWKDQVNREYQIQLLQCISA